MTTTPTRNPKSTVARRSPREWRQLIRLYERGGLSRKAFCAQHNVALSTFDWWRSRSRKASDPSESIPARAKNSSMPAPLFVEVGGPAEQIAVKQAGWDIELDLGAGMVLRLRRASC